MANYTSNVYVSYRVRNRGDLGLGADMHQKVRARLPALLMLLRYFYDWQQGAMPEHALSRAGYHACK